MKLRAKIVAPVIVLAAALIAAAAMISARPTAESARPPLVAPLVEVVRGIPGTVRLRVEAQGSVVPGTESELVSEVAGRIVDVSPQLAAGGFIDAGDVLARIDPRDYEVALESARATLASAEADLTLASATLKRHRSMRQTGASSRARLDEAVHGEASATAGVRQAQVGLDRASLDLERTEVRAPFAGRVREKRVDVGQFVTRGAPIARVYSTDYAEVRLPVSDEDLAYLNLALGFRDEAFEEGEVAQGPAVEISGRFAGAEHIWRGHVVRTEGALDARTRMINVIARIEDPYGRKDDLERPPLPIGLFVQASIEGRLAEAVFDLPRAALRGRDEVVVVDRDDRLRFRNVDVLRADRDRVLIRSGLGPNERLVVSQLEVATEGMKVRTTERTESPSSALRSARAPGS